MRASGSHICYAKAALGYKEQIMAGVIRYRVCKSGCSVASARLQARGAL